MSIYAMLKDKDQRIVREKSWHDTLLSIMADMFQYEGLPVRTNFLELYLLVFGECAIWETKDGWAVTRCNRAGKPNTNGEGSDLICTTDNGQSVTFRNFEESAEVVWLKNDSLAQPDTRFEIFADILTEIETSIKSIIRNSRYMPIIMTRDEKAKVAINEILAELNTSGKPQAIISRNIIEGEDSATVLNITDVNASDKIQYLYKAIDDTLRLFYNRIGMEVCGASKMAQQSVAEVNAGCNSHEIIPNLRLKEREKAIEDCREKFGWDCSVRFSEPWQKEIEEVTEEAEQEEVENPVDNVESEGSEDEEKNV